MSQIIWDGSKQEFMAEQIQDAQKLGDDYWAIVALFISDILKYKVNRWEFVVHHIDGNHENNHPSNLMLMTRSAHNALHNHLWWESLSCEEQNAWGKKQKEFWSSLSDDEYKLKCEIARKSRTPGVRASISAGVQKVWADYTKEERIERGENKCLSKQLVQSEIFLKTYSSTFSRREFENFTGYACAHSVLSRLAETDHIEVVGKGDYGVILYKSLICEE